MKKQINLIKRIGLINTFNLRFSTTCNSKRLEIKRSFSGLRTTVKSNMSDLYEYRYSITISSLFYLISSNDSSKNLILRHSRYTPIKLIIFFFI